MKCKSCKAELATEDAMQVVGKNNERFFIHRPDTDGRCFTRAVLGKQTHTISVLSQPEVETAKNTYPYYCPECPEEDYYGRIIFDDAPIPVCPNVHRDQYGEKYEVHLIPTRRFRDPKYESREFGTAADPMGY